MKSSDTDTIGRLAAHFGLATHVLRHWESVGLLTPGRLVNGHRRYGPEHYTRVALIKHGKEAGFSLDQLRAMLTGEDGPARRLVLREHRDELARRVARAQASVAMLDHALACPAQDFLRCPDFQAMVDDLVSGDCECGPQVSSAAGA